ncbi:uncharacterized protein MEPE_01913 [Melanopsichium pennsylvanicum]|uniref:Uncharacterized protein n=2 Tax=Melanopsichium pennsylvanicum TaxID=63383 RepID=A0AAJ5C432_9BASI|nr:hypothetical protein BN887_05878 [Melanopsichium pennsylvanicum 4]SNX83207.1 uncharacterized protein MEPE_01913 [Melanopsichium pennsylvanicum]
MLEQQESHVFTRSSSPSLQRPPPTQQQPLPRSILKKSHSDSAPTSTFCSSIYPVSSNSSPTMSPRSEAFSLPAYQPDHWTLVGIARAQQRTRFIASSTASAIKNAGLTVTLLYVPTETLFAWPFNLSSPESKGVCFETYSVSQQDGMVRRPPDGAMSTSLRLLAEVIRCWMKIQRERAAQHKRSGSDGSDASRTNIPRSSVDAIVDNDEVVDRIVETLGLIQLTPLERSLHLLRQVLPEQCSPEDDDRDERGHALSLAKSSSSAESDEDRERQRWSESSSSSRASTVEPSIFADQPSPRKASCPKLPKINTAVPSQEATSVPQIRLVEATPQELQYAERDRAFEMGTASRNSTFSGRGMNTVHEDTSEDTEVEATSTYDSGEVIFIKVHSCNQKDVSEEPECRKAASAEMFDAKKASQINKEAPSISSSKVFFRDPFKSVKRRSSKPNIVRVETIESGSPESLSSSVLKSKSTKRPSFESLRSVFGGQNKLQSK